jgi:RNA polymerase sigma factor (sigma-70 family)
MRVLVSSQENDTYCCSKTKLKSDIEVHLEVRKWRKNLTEILENPVIKEFLEDKDNAKAFYTALERPSEKNVKELDRKFKQFYRINRIIRYLSGLVRRYPIDFDKRVKRRNSRYQLILNSAVGDSGTTMGDLIPDNDALPLDILMQKEQGLLSGQNDALQKALKTLNRKQNELLYLYYVKGYNNREIGQIFGQTEQNISYWHKKTLKQLREKML